MNQADKAMAQQYAQAAMQQLPVGYQNAQAVRQQALGQGLGLAGQTFQPTAEMINQGGHDEPKCFVSWSTASAQRHSW
jgi:hypothetical protein